MPVSKSKSKNLKPKTVAKPVKKVAAKPAVKSVKAVEAKPKATTKIEASVKGSLKIDVYDLKGKVVEQTSLPKEIFGVKVNNALMAQAVRVYLANQRRGTVSTKTRGEVQGSSAKIYRQKGTGKARHGSKRAPIFVHGGLVFGPKPRDYSMDLNKKMRKASLFSSLTLKNENGEIKIIKGLEKIEPKAKLMEEAVRKLGFEVKKRKILLVTDSPKTENVYRATKNLKGVEIISANMLNTYEVLNSKVIVLMKDAIEVIENTFLKKEKN
jgi:large subunit ribosomal protein L4